MKGLLLVPMAFAIALTTGCAGLREDLGIFDGHHRELKHRVNGAERDAAVAQATANKAVADAAAAQATADAAKAAAEAAQRTADMALANSSKK